MPGPDPNPPPPASHQEGPSRPPRRLGVIVPRGGGAFARGMLAGVDSRRGRWQTVDQVVVLEQGGGPHPWRWASASLAASCLLIADGAVMVLIFLGLTAAAPLYEIASDAIAPRLEQASPIMGPIGAFVLRLLNLPFLLAIAAVPVGLVVCGVAHILTMNSEGARSFLRRWFRFFVVVGLLGWFTAFAQWLGPGETARTLIGMLLILIGATSRYGFPSRRPKDLLFVAGAALTADGVASLIWDSGSVWLGCGLVLVGGICVLVRRRLRVEWFSSSAPALAKAMDELRLLVQGLRQLGLRYLTQAKATDELRSFAQGVRELGLRYLTMAKTTDNAPFLPLQLHSMDALVVCDPKVFQNLAVDGGQAEAVVDCPVKGWQQRLLRLTASGQARVCIVYCPHQRLDGRYARARGRVTTQKVLDWRGPGPGSS
jgi:hypothetical protein